MLDTPTGSRATDEAAHAAPGSPDTVDHTAELLSLSASLGVEQCDASAVTIYLGATGTRLRVPRALYDIMLAFDAPRTSAAVARGDARFERALDRLRGLGFLVGETDAAAPPPRAVTDPPYRLFDCPAQKPSSGRADIVVVGVPYDGGDHEAAGARHGPIALRQTSLQLLYGLDKRTGQPLGWFDADVRRPVLRGVTIGDAGDVLVVSGESQATTFARLRGVLDTLAAKDPHACAVLGGDATTAFPLIEAMQARGALAVLRIGDVADDACADPAGFLSAATLPGRVLALPNVDRFVQVGTVRSSDGAPPGYAAVPTSALIDRSVAAIEPHLAPGRALHLGLDLGILAGPADPPGGGPRIAYAALRSLLHAIGERYRIVSLDLVGINPSKRDWGVTSVAAVHLLLAMLDAATNGNERDATA